MLGSIRSVATRILVAFESTRTLPQSSNKWKSSLWMCRSWVKSHGYTFRSSPGSSRWVSRPHLHPSPTCRRTCRNPEALHQSQCNLHLLLWWPEDHPDGPNGKPNTPSTKNSIFLLFWSILSSKPSSQKGSLKNLKFTTFAVPNSQCVFSFPSGI